MRERPTPPSPSPASPCGCRPTRSTLRARGRRGRCWCPSSGSTTSPSQEKKGQFSAELDVLLTVTHYATGRTLGDRPVGIQLAARSDVRGQNAWHRITQEVEPASRRLGGQARGPGPQERGRSEASPTRWTCPAEGAAGLLSGAERRPVGDPSPSCSTRCHWPDGRSPRPEALLRARGLRPGPGRDDGPSARLRRIRRHATRGRGRAAGSARADRAHGRPQAGADAHRPAARPQAGRLRSRPPARGHGHGPDRRSCASRSR